MRCQGHSGFIVLIVFLFLTSCFPRQPVNPALYEECYDYNYDAFGGITFTIECEAGNGETGTDSMLYSATIEKGELSVDFADDEDPGSRSNDLRHYRTVSEYILQLLFSVYDTFRNYITLLPKSDIETKIAPTPEDQLATDFIILQTMQSKKTKPEIRPVFKKTCMRYCVSSFDLEIESIHYRYDIEYECMQMLIFPRIITFIDINDGHPGPLVITATEVKTSLPHGLVHPAEDR
ncbi:MAG: hypothetical protein JW881_08000 [Spirochaetales bacterium]|nr:hypothetical protein [Spirochaetales bacterium]